MHIKRQLSALSLAVAAGLPMAVLSTAVSAQTYSTSTAVSSFGVEQVERLAPGNVIGFSLDATPGSVVTLDIAGATAGVRLDEVQPGRYRGEYTIRQRDRLTAASRVTARVARDGQSTSATLGRSLLLGARDPVLPQSAAQITAFNVDAPERVRPGDELRFSMTGTPGGKARVAIQGIGSPIQLTETSRGVYEGTYVMRRQDRLRGDLLADGYLVSDRRETSQRYERQLARFDGYGNGNGNGNGRNDARNDGRGNRDGRQQAVATCAACGSVVSVDRVEVKGDSPNIIGTVAGGVLGGVAGRQVGSGSGQDIATVIGAIGGAIAGNRVENNMGRKTVYRVTVRLDSGGSQNYDYADDPAVQVGTRVKAENGVLIRL